MDFILDNSNSLVIVIVFKIIYLPVGIFIVMIVYRFINFYCMYQFIILYYIGPRMVQ